MQAGASFQYIPCYGLSGRQVKEGEILLDFNTSHVTVYRMLRNGGLKGDPISIHPMLRFIMLGVLKCITKLHFNTSHVTVYHILGFNEFSVCQFQYIPCYGLSMNDNEKDAKY